MRAGQLTFFGPGVFVTHFKPHTVTIYLFLYDIYMNLACFSVPVVACILIINHANHQEEIQKFICRENVDILR